MQDGLIELESGRWKWQVTELRGRSGPYRAGEREAGTADPDDTGTEDGQTVLLLEDPENAGDWMTCDLATRRDGDDIPRDELERLAREPDLRQLSGPEGKVWTFEPVPRPEAVEKGRGYDQPQQRVRASKDGAPARLVSLPREATLGSLGRDELLALVEQE